MPNDAKKMQNEQIDFWRGQFGDSYSGRNAPDTDLLRARVAMWSEIMRGTCGAAPASILEVGANIGNNLRALRTLTGAEFWAVEPNALARQQLIDDGFVEEGNAMDGVAQAIPLKDGAVDMAFTCGVLIHIHPDDLPASCREIYRVASRYIACVEYFSDKPEMIPYRGHNDRLFKRDFGDFWLDHFPSLQLVDYGFRWKRATGLDNLTWWLFEKR